MVGEPSAPADFGTAAAAGGAGGGVAGPTLVAASCSARHLQDGHTLCRRRQGRRASRSALQVSHSDRRHLGPGTTVAGRSVDTCGCNKDEHTEARLLGVGWWTL